MLGVRSAPGELVRETRVTFGQQVCCAVRVPAAMASRVGALSPGHGTLLIEACGHGRALTH